MMPSDRGMIAPKRNAPKMKLTCIHWHAQAEKNSPTSTPHSLGVTHPARSKAGATSLRRNGRTTPSITRKYTGTNASRQDSWPAADAIATTAASSA